VGNFRIRKKEMENTTIDKIMRRQFERMKNELMAINIPQGYLTIISKYWDFAMMDIDDYLIQFEFDEIDVELKRELIRQG
jgi:hypothetical protein